MLYLVEILNGIPYERCFVPVVAEQAIAEDMALHYAEKLVEHYTKNRMHGELYHFEKMVHPHPSGMHGDVAISYTIVESAPPRQIGNLQRSATRTYIAAVQVTEAVMGERNASTWPRFA